MYAEGQRFSQVKVFTIKGLQLFIGAIHCTTIKEERTNRMFKVLLVSANYQITYLLIQCYAFLMFFYKVIKQGEICAAHLYPLQMV